MPSPEEFLREAISSLELEDIYLNSFNLEREDDFNIELIPEGMKQHTSYRVSAGIYDLDGQDSPYPKIFKAIVSFSVAYSTEENLDVGDKLAYFEANFVVAYSLKNEITEEAVSQFSKKNVVHNAWPFWRELVFDLARRANLPQPRIPLFSDAKPLALGREKTSEQSTKAQNH